MPRSRRSSLGGFCYHILNRGNKKAQVFHDDEDYQQFESLIGEANRRVSFRMLAYCLMPNHFHLVAWPRKDHDTSHWLHWLLTTYVRRYHAKYRTEGRLWQGRTKQFPIQSSTYLQTVLRYVERNPLRANLVSSAQDWRWSSLYHCVAGSSLAGLTEGPVEKPEDWTKFVNTALTTAELSDLRRCVQRQCPYGGTEWVKDTADRMGLEFSLRSMGGGRPWAGKTRKVPKKEL